VKKNLGPEARALASVEKKLRKGMSFVHKGRCDSLFRGVEALLTGGRLWLTALGRAMPTQSKRKHAIKAADRLLGNPHLHSERAGIAAVVAELLLRDAPRPVLLVDTMEIRHRVVALTAAVPFDGRTIPIWSKVVRSLKVKLDVCREFFDELEQVLPAGAQPTIVTDAGFEAPWLNEVLRRNWHYVARVRGQVKICIEDQWRSCHELHQLAGSSPQDLGIAQFPKNTEKCRDRRLVLSARPVSRHRQVQTRTGPSRDTNYQVYRLNAYEPLILATSLDSEPRHIVRLYKKRMQIEQTFRDEKSHRHGWSLRHCGSRSFERIETLLLIAMIAMTIQLVVGLAAELRGLRWQHQANTERVRRVISLSLLGRLVIQCNQTHLIKQLDIDQALALVRNKLEHLHPSSSA